MINESRKGLKNQTSEKQNEECNDEMNDEYINNIVLSLDLNEMVIMYGDK